MKRIGLHVGLMTLAVLAGCERQVIEPGPGETARIRLVHGAEATAALALLVDGEVIVNGLGPSGISEYVEVDAGSHQLRVNATGSAQALVQRSVDLEADRNYTLLVSGSLVSPEDLLASDTAGIPIPGKVKIRILHGARNAPPLDVYLTAPGVPLSGEIPVVEPFTFGFDTTQFPGFVERDPGDYEVRFTDDGTTNVVLSSGTFTASGGEVITVILSHDDGGGLAARVIRESPGTLPQTAFIRVVHAAPAAGPVSVHVTEPGADLAQPHLFIAPFTYGADSSTVTFMLPGTNGQLDLEVRFTGVSDLGVLASSGAFTTPVGAGRRVTLQPAPGGGLEAVVTTEP